LRWQMAAADRELYKFLHTKLTVKLKATSVLTCQPGMGFELYRILKKKLDPNNLISEHTILADIRRLAFAKAANLTDTRARVVQLVALCNEYCDKTVRRLTWPRRRSPFGCSSMTTQRKRAYGKTLLRATSLSPRCATTWRPSARRRAIGRPL